LLSHEYNNYLAGLFFSYGNNRELFTEMIVQFIDLAKTMNKFDLTSKKGKRKFIQKLPKTIAKGGHFPNFIKFITSEPIYWELLKELNLGINDQID
jgi:hypothetical protein